MCPVELSARALVIIGRKRTARRARDWWSVWFSDPGFVYPAVQRPRQHVNAKAATSHRLRPFYPS